MKISDKQFVKLVKIISISTKIVIAPFWLFFYALFYTYDGVLKSSAAIFSWWKYDFIKPPSSDWNKWFAWIPVKAYSGQYSPRYKQPDKWIWMEFVLRRHWKYDINHVEYLTIEVRS